MKLISWNVNGIRACLQKGFEDAFRTLNADFFCLQETKAQPHQVELDLPGYRQYWYSAEKNLSLSFRPSSSACSRAFSFSASCRSAMDWTETQLSGVRAEPSTGGCFREKDWSRHWMSRLEEIILRSVVM